jgi:cell division protein FtsW (lipid II flippase)
MAVAAVAVIPLAYTVAVPDYQRERLAVFVHPGRDPFGSGFTLRQVEVAFGSGGLFGNGMLEGAHSALEGLATRTSDFAFAQVGEALGLVGAVAVIAIFAIVAWRGIRAATVAPDAFGRLLAVGLTATITAQALMHIAVNLRLFPATGIALPFVSQGGSALVTMFAAIGLLESIAAHRPATGREQWTGERWH